MLLALDRFVLSKTEETTQFLQRYFGIKLTTLCSTAAATCIFLVLTKWCFVAQLKNESHLGDVVYILVMLFYIFFYAKHHQRDLENWAAKRTQNPYKVVFVIVFTRIAWLLMTILQTILAFLYSSTTQQLISLIDSFAYGFFLYAFCVDVLPPSANKETSWIKTIFSRRVLSS
jgi:membrane protease YdiL (CAAX protease family)